MLSYLPKATPQPMESARHVSFDDMAQEEYTRKSTFANDRIIMAGTSIRDTDDANSSTRDQALPESLMSLTKVSALQLPDMPACFKCPISGRPMADPLIATNGKSYDRRSVEVLIESNMGRPGEVDGCILDASNMTPNTTLKASISAFLHLRSSITLQWEEAEYAICRYMDQSSSRLEMRERRAKDLRKQLHWLGIAEEPTTGTLLSARSRGVGQHLKPWRESGDEALWSHRSGNSSLRKHSSLQAVYGNNSHSHHQHQQGHSQTSGAYNSIQVSDAEQEVISTAPAQACAFSAGPAPRSARGPNSARRARHPAGSQPHGKSKPPAAAANGNGPRAGDTGSSEAAPAAGQSAMGEASSTARKTKVPTKPSVWSSWFSMNSPSFMSMMSPSRRGS
mmetsp:Transcript_9841/g.21641  ORF Transcript_9841/g.21641 Transcript_9841/m.21641 type:complete len:394 (-) Transcript_9841:263-1444(-)